MIFFDYHFCGQDASNGKLRVEHIKFKFTLLAFITSVVLCFVFLWLFHSSGKDGSLDGLSFEYPIEGHVVRCLYRDLLTDKSTKDTTV